MAAALAVLWGVPIVLPLLSAFRLPLPVAWCLPSLFYVCRCHLPCVFRCRLPFVCCCHRHYVHPGDLLGRNSGKPLENVELHRMGWGLGLGLGLEILFEAPFFHTLRLHPVAGAGAGAKAVGRSQ